MSAHYSGGKRRRAQARRENSDLEKNSEGKQTKMEKCKTDQGMLKKNRPQGE